VSPSGLHYKGNKRQEVTDMKRPNIVAPNAGRLDSPANKPQHTAQPQTIEVRDMTGPN